MNVLVACEESQVVCIEFRKIGHNAFSCDLQSCSGGSPEWHIQRDVFEIINGGFFETCSGETHYICKWDMIIAHPPCTYLSKVSSKCFREGVHTYSQVCSAVDFFMKFYNLRYIQPDIKLCIENPVPMAICGLPAFSQTIQPYEFGDEWTKLTCLWLYNLPPLIGQCYAPIGHKRNCCPSYVYHKFGSKLRSKTFIGIARAMAIQWG